MDIVIRRSIETYPKMQVEDLYKLIYQAAMGCEHALSDVGYAKSILEQELGELQPSAAEPLIESISPNGSIVRVNLRPYLQSDRDPLELFEAFLQTAREYQGNLDALRQYIRVALKLNHAGTLPYDEQRLIQFFNELEQAGFPAVHHSRQYREAYSPAYRVIYRAFFPTAFM
ncbi:MAG: hypothetical protein PVI04_09105 [Anaerolineales bacterium]|jgi:hypothetical protein